MKSKLESAYSKALTGTFKVISPIKRTIKTLMPIISRVNSSVFPLLFYSYDISNLNRYTNGRNK